MERLDVFDCSNVLIASYFTDDRGCAHENREHTLIYLCSGELEIEERGKKTVLHPGDCAFMRRDNRMWLHLVFSWICYYYDSSKNEAKPKKYMQNTKFRLPYTKLFSIMKMVAT